MASTLFFAIPWGLLLLSLCNDNNSVAGMDRIPSMHDVCICHGRHHDNGRGDVACMPHQVHGIRRDVNDRCLNSAGIRQGSKMLPLH